MSGCPKPSPSGREGWMLLVPLLNFLYAVLECGHVVLGVLSREQDLEVGACLAATAGGIWSGGRGGGGGGERHRRGASQGQGQGKG